MLEVSYISPDGKLIEVFEMADEMTLNQAAKTICPDTGGKFPVPTIAIVGTKPAVRKLGDWDYKLSGAKIQFRQLAMGGGGGGGSNPLQMVMQIAIIALAAAATWYIGGLGGTMLGMGMQFWGGLAGAGIMMLGTLLMGALFQQKLPQGQVGAMNAEQASPTYSINASGNQARLYQTEPELFGRMKITPDFVANTWTMYINNDQIGYFVYGIGRGRYSIESLQFGETVFWRNGALVSDSGYEITDIQFVEPGGKVTIFPDNIVTSDEVNGQTLYAPNSDEFSGAIGPYTTNPPGTQTTRLLFDFIFQQGLGQYNNKGELQAYTVSWRIQYRRVDDFDVAKSEWATLENISLTMSTVTPQRITKTYNVPSGRYQCRVVRTSDTTSDGRTMDNLVWGAMRAMLPGTYEYPISCVAFAIRANNALTQNASRQFSIIATRKLPLYNRQSKTWSAETPTRSWAAAISHVAKCEWGGRLKDSNIDLDTLWAIDERLQAKNWHYDSYIDGPYLVWNLICEMCQSQCVIPRLIGPVLSFLEDRPNRAPSFALTPRNIIRNTFGITYMTWSDDTPDDVTVEYLDSAYGFQNRDVTAILPESESKEPSSLDILGITDRNHAHKVAVAYAAHNRWQRIVVECQVEALGRIINRGDICTVSHPRFKNTGSGIVYDWNESILEICIHVDNRPESEDGFYIDSPYKEGKLLRLGVYGLDMGNNILQESPESTLFINPDISEKNTGLSLEDGEYLALTRPDGSIWGPCKLASLTGYKAVFDSADYSTLLLQGQGNPFEWLTKGIKSQPISWILYKSKTYQRLMVVDSIQSQDLLHYNLRLLNYDERIYQYGNLPVPVWQGRGQLPVYETIGTPQNLHGIAIDAATLTLTWLNVEGAEWYEVQTSDNNVNWTDKGRANIGQIIVAVSPGIVYARVRAMNNQLTGKWATWSGNTLIKPPAVPNPAISQAYRGGEATVSWDAVTGATGYGISVKGGGRVVYSATITNLSFTITPEIQEGGPYRNLVFSIYAIGQGGNSNTAQINISDAAPMAPTAADVHISGNSLVVESITPALPVDGTGYIFVEGNGPDFGVDDIIASKQVAILPYTWPDLSSGVHYFRAAMRDEFFQIAQKPLDLNWSDVITLTVD